ncbi:GGDEF domain-containing protein [Magnetofaba australis]|uniref:diguanylate cyclase n=1 Tax=Magnetofaba australis IT-1 TaxID=1434232 RepID=A0A1Y2K5C2_9PROT|nr:GGDEF domain-containing protein [Magnetofaba australis]OSM04884.1 putative diguanylate cyclase [Magnetofaba australis IT-1]
MSDTSPDFFHTATAIQQDGVITAEEAQQLRAALGDTAPTEAHAKALYTINDAVRFAKNAPGWQSVYVELLSEYLLNRAEPMGALSPADAEEVLTVWRAAINLEIPADAKAAPDANEFALLLHLYLQSTTSPQAFQQTILQQIKTEVLGDGQIDEMEINLIEKVLGKGRTDRRIGPMEAKLILEINAQQADKPDNAAWSKFYAQSAGSFIDQTRVVSDEINSMDLECERFADKLKDLLADDSEAAKQLAGITDQIHAATERMRRCLAQSREIMQVSHTYLGQTLEELRRVKLESLTDPLTRIANRRAFADYLQRELDRTARYHRPLSMVLFDLDHFKKVNDTYGHPVGDRVLMMVADAVSHTIRDEDFFARYGGEEFAVLLPETARDNAMEMAEKVRATVEALEIPLNDGQTLKITTSLGVGWLAPNAPVPTPVNFTDNADQALYVAKESGRNRVTAADKPAA